LRTAAGGAAIQLYGKLYNPSKDFSIYLEILQMKKPPRQASEWQIEGGISRPENEKTL